MSQNMAESMAKEGKDYKEILNYFFEGNCLKRDCGNFERHRISFLVSGKDNARGDEDEWASAL